MAAAVQLLAQVQPDNTLRRRRLPTVSRVVDGLRGGGRCRACSCVLPAKSGMLGN
jgi:hypothetical protein